MSDLLGVGGGDTDLRSRQLLLVYLVIDEDRVLEDDWIFFPEKQFPFSRLFEQKAMSAELGPEGKTVLCCDLTCDLDDELWKSSDRDIAKRCLRALESVGVTSEDRLLASFVKRFRDFYPVYSIDYRERLAERYYRDFLPMVFEVTSRVLGGVAEAASRYPITGVFETTAKRSYQFFGALHPALVPIGLGLMLARNVPRLVFSTWILTYFLLLPGRASCSRSFCVIDDAERADSWERVSYSG